MKKLLLFLLCAIALGLQSCHFDVNVLGTYKNDQIDQSVRTEIAAIDKKLFKCIMTKDVDGVKKIMSPTLVSKTGKKIDTIVNFIGATFKATDYRLIDEYYTRNLEDGANTLVKSDRGDLNDYQIKYVAKNKDTYVSVMVSTGLPVNCMVLSVYGRYDDGWKLNILQMGEYNILDQTAPEYYQSATRDYDKGRLVDAVDMIITTRELMHPGGEIFEYLKDYQISNTDSLVLKSANDTYHLPLTLAGIKTKPRIFGVGPRFMANAEPKGIVPVIRYTTRIPISDTVALRAENKAIQLVVTSMFKGIDKNKPAIVYQAFNQTTEANVKYYNFIQRLRYGKSE